MYHTNKVGQVQAKEACSYRDHPADPIRFYWGA